MTRQWPRIILLWLLGVLAAAQFAKMSIIAPLLRATFGLSLPQIGWLISLLEVGGGLFGFAAGLALARASVRRFLLLGLMILAATSIVESLTSSMTVLFGARAIEGVGYLLVVIAAPTAIAATASDAVRPRALALWSTFVPVGIAAGAEITGVLLPATGARGIMLLWTVLIVLAGASIMRLPIATSECHRVRLPALAAWVSTFGFGLYTVFISAVTMLLPSFLVQCSGASLGEAALIAALASAAALPGTGFAMWAMRDGPMNARRSATFSAVSLLATVPLTLTLYHADGLALTARAGLSILAVMISGVVPPIVFARLPQQAGATAPDDPRIATANGLITQFGAGGAFVGPPLGGMIVGLWDWEGLGVVASIVVILLLATIVLAEGITVRVGRAEPVRLA
jgi:MFS family permease